jgi:sirohydrochlorin ferrochelatase
MNYSEPTFLEAVKKCHSAGATQVLILPFFLVPGYFVSKSLPEHVAQAQAQFPELQFFVAEAIGFDERLADAVIEAAQQPLGPDEWRDDLTAAARHCRARPDCPLYGTPNCPRVPAPDTPARLFVE